MPTIKNHFDSRRTSSTQIGTLDEHHNELRDLTNSLFDAAFKRKASSVIVDIIDSLLEKCRVHCEMEEALLHRIKHKDMEIHANHNRQLIALLARERAKHQEADIPLFFDVLCSLKHWLIEHCELVIDGGNLDTFALLSANKGIVEVPQ